MSAMKRKKGNNKGLAGQRVWYMKTTQKSYYILLYIYFYIKKVAHSQNSIHFNCNCLEVLTIDIVTKKFYKNMQIPGIH